MPQSSSIKDVLDPNVITSAEKDVCSQPEPAVGGNTDPESLDNGNSTLSTSQCVSSDTYIKVNGNRKPYRVTRAGRRHQYSKMRKMNATKPEIRPCFANAAERVGVSSNSLQLAVNRHMPVPAFENHTSKEQNEPATKPPGTTTAIRDLGKEVAPAALPKSSTERVLLVEDTHSGETTTHVTALVVRLRQKSE